MLIPKVSTQQFWYDFGSGQAPYESNFTGCGCNFGTAWEIVISFQQDQISLSSGP